MIETPSPSGALTSLEAAVAALLEGLAPVPPKPVPLAAALGLVAAEMPATATPLPPTNRAEIDGWAFRATDLAGASSYAPLAMTGSPAWVEAGEPLPPGCDCVLEPEFAERAGPLFSVLGEAAPGQGVRRAGEDAAVGRPVAPAGRAVTASDLALARGVGLETILVRSPDLRVIDISTSSHPGISVQMVGERLRTAGAGCDHIEMCAKDRATIVETLLDRPADLIVLVGGTGRGKSDVTVAAVTECSSLIAHRIALQPGLTTAIGRLNGIPVIALSGMPGHALGACLALVEPVVDRLSGRLPRRGMALPLLRKVASGVGLAEICLVRLERDGWMPLVIGDATLDLMREADAWLVVPASEEGYAHGTRVSAFPLHDWR